MKKNLKKINIMGKRIYVDDRFSDIVENGVKRVIETAEIMGYEIERSDLREEQFGANASFDLAFFDEEDYWVYSCRFLLIHLDRWQETFELTTVACYESKYEGNNSKKTYSHKISHVGDHGLENVKISFEGVFNVLCEKILLIDQLTN
ncbi:hypothetical protein D3C87_82490 [compost metagenome]